MIEEKCKDCAALVVPFLNRVDEHNCPLPETFWTGTCKKSLSGAGHGFYGSCYPDICEGAEGRNYVVGLNGETREYEYKFIGGNWVSYIRMNIQRLFMRKK